MEQIPSSPGTEPALGFSQRRIHRPVFVTTDSPGSFSYRIDLDAYAVASKEEFDKEVEEIFAFRRHS